MDIFSGDGEYDYNPQIDEVDEEVDYEDIDAYNDYKEESRNDDEEDDGIGCLPIILALIIIGGIVYIF